MQPDSRIQRFPRALLLAHNRTIALQVLYSLADAAEVHVLGDAGTESLRRSRFCRSYASVDEAGWENAIVGAMAEHRIDVVVPADESTSRILSALAPAHGIPSFPLSSPELLRQLSDKWLFHHLCQSHGVPTPDSLFFATKQGIDVGAIERQIGFPLVIKPAEGSNSVGVIVIRSAEELQRKILANPGYGFANLVVQKFAPGIDIDFSLLAIEGRILAEAVQSRTGRAVVFSRCAPLARACRTLIERIHFSGPAHFDARYDAATGEVRLIECNPRFWASLDAARWCGLNFAAAGVRYLFPQAWRTEAPVLEAGAYLHPAGLIEALAKRHWRSPGLTAASLKGLWQAARDPVPFLDSELYAWRRRREERRRFQGGQAPAVVPAEARRRAGSH